MNDFTTEVANSSRHKFFWTRSNIFDIFDSPKHFSDVISDNQCFENNNYGSIIQNLLNCDSVLATSVFKSLFRLINL